MLLSCDQAREGLSQQEGQRAGLCFTLRPAQHTWMSILIGGGSAGARYRRPLVALCHHVACMLLKGCFASGKHYLPGKLHCAHQVEAESSTVPQALWWQVETDACYALLRRMALS